MGKGERGGRGVNKKREENVFIYSGEQRELGLNITLGFGEGKLILDQFYLKCVNT